MGEEKGAATDAATERAIEPLLGRLTRAEKVRLTAGAGPWTTLAVPRLGIPALKMSDGMVGARGDRFHGTTSACFPCGAALGATWNPELVRQIGDALGEETRSKGARVLLAPTLNLHRFPLAGRNFECFSEDPILAARMGVAYIRGVQGRGVAAVAKHFVCNDAERERETIDSVVSERAQRELYLRPFAAAVRDGGVWAVMSAYNRLNGVYCSQNTALLTALLRQEWGFDGLVMSDWGGTHDALAAVRAGLDLQMPGPVPPSRHESLTQSASLDDATLDAAVRRVLSLLARTGALTEPSPHDESSQDLPRHRMIARQAAVEAAVLLTNNGLLPLDRSRIRTLAVIGPNAARTPLQGGGSAFVNPPYNVSILDGLRAALGDKVDVLHEPGCTNNLHCPPLDGALLHAASGRPGLDIAFFDATRDDGEPVGREWSPRSHLLWIGSPVAGFPLRDLVIRAHGQLVPAVSGAHRLGLMSAGHTVVSLDGAVVLDSATAEGTGESFFGRGTPEIVADVALEAGRAYDLRVELRPVGEASATAGLTLGCAAPEPSDMLERAIAAAARAAAAVVVVGTTGEWETEGGDRADMRLPGRQDELVRRVCAANPRTAVVLTSGAPLETPWIDECAACLLAWFGGQEVGNAVADLLLGGENPSGRLPMTFPRTLEQAVPLGYENGRITYGEDLCMGYRHFDAHGLEPRFCFGHGLSYTTFAYGPVSLDRSGWRPGETVTCSITVKNSGDRAGKETVQLYVGFPADGTRPPRELRDFRKVALAPGEEQTVSFALDDRTFACWDADAHAWGVPTGTVEIAVGSSSRALRAVARLRLEPASGGS